MKKLHRAQAQLLLLTVIGGLVGCGELSEATARPGAVQQPLQSQDHRTGDGDMSVSRGTHARIQRALSRSPDNLRIRTRPDGLHDVEVLSGFQHMTLLSRRPDGTFAQHCTNDADDVDHLLTQGKP